MNARRMRTQIALVAALFAAAAWLAACTGNAAATPDRTALEAARSPADTAREIAITVHKRAGCSCCGRWIQHLRDNGFRVEAVEEPEAELQATKTRLGVPEELRSCHTATVDGYVIEGHVPAQVIRRFLEEAPDVAGLAVPGMPIGSPGMEVEGVDPEPYDVLAFERDGNVTIYASFESP